MADQSSNTAPLDHNIDFHIITLFERLEALRKRSNGGVGTSNCFSTQLHINRTMNVELRSLEFWRSIISECLASFFYVFIVCGAAAGAGVGASVSSVLLATSLAAGLAMATLTQSFLHISGAHINPAVTLAACVIRVISPIRAAMYVTAQCGGGIAGAALLCSITAPGYQGNVQAAVAQSALLASWERFGIEFILTFVVVLSYFVSTDSLKKRMGNPAVSIGVSYSACSFVSMPNLNPVRSLGPAFVLNRWDHHWVYWFGPVIGGICSGIIYQYIFNRKIKSGHDKASSYNDSLSIRTEDDFNCDLDLEKSNVQNKYTKTLPSSGHLISNMQKLYSAQPHRSNLESHEPVYDGARSMYSRTPTFPRANLCRSQSVYTKSNGAINREIISQPIQNAYPIQNPESKIQNHILQNQMHQGVENYYTIRGTPRQSQQPHHIQYEQREQKHQQHATRIQQSNQQTYQNILTTHQTSTPNEVTKNYVRHPEMIYGLTVQRARGHSTQSDDSSYGSFLSSTKTSPTRIATNETMLTHTSSQKHTKGAQLLDSTSPIRREVERNVTMSVKGSKLTTPPAFAGKEAYKRNADKSTNSRIQSAL